MTTAPRTVGVEEEFLLFHRERPTLFGVGPEVAETAAEDDPDAQFEKELKAAQTEAATKPMTDLAALANELASNRRELAAAARAHDARLVCSGTSPVPGRSTVT